jgi:hypothetical protein
VCWSSECRGKDRTPFIFIPSVHTDHPSASGHSPINSVQSVEQVNDPEQEKCLRLKGKARRLITIMVIASGLLAGAPLEPDKIEELIRL